MVQRVMSDGGEGERRGGGGVTTADRDRCMGDRRWKDTPVGDEVIFHSDINYFTTSFRLRKSFNDRRDPHYTSIFSREVMTTSATIF